MNEGWDVTVLISDKVIKLQVKAVTWPNSDSNTKPAIRGYFDAEFDVLIVVVIDFYRTNKYATFVIPKPDLIQAGEG